MHTPARRGCWAWAHALLLVPGLWVGAPALAAGAKAPASAPESAPASSPKSAPKSAPVAAPKVPSVLPLQVFLDLLDVPSSKAAAALARIDRHWHDSHAALLLEASAFMPNHLLQQDAIDLVARKAGLATRDLDALSMWLWAVDRPTYPHHAAFKARLYERLDPRFSEHFDRQPALSIRLDEVRWGGVPRDGIPPLQHPTLIDAADATWLADDDVVFGVAIDGDVRAYPQRILAWHELVNDRIAGREITGVYCTLCGAMILYEATVRGVHHRLGTSGFLYRSNKLMYDAATKSLWSTLTGTPVVGPLVSQGIRLRSLSLVTTRWKAWRERHPGTRVLSLETGHLRDYSEGAAYRSYFASDALMFSVPRNDNRLANKDEVLALRFPQAPDEVLAIAAKTLASRRLLHAQVGPVRLVVLTDDSGANRVYAAGDAPLVRWDGRDQAYDANGTVWRVAEDALHGPAGQTRPRLPAHRAFWFGWVAAFPHTRLIQ